MDESRSGGAEGEGKGAVEQSVRKPSDPGISGEAGAERKLFGPPLQKILLALAVLSLALVLASAAGGQPVRLTVLLALVTGGVVGLPFYLHSRWKQASPAGWSKATSGVRDWTATLLALGVTAFILNPDPGGSIGQAIVAAMTVGLAVAWAKALGYVSDEDEDK